MNLQPVTGKPFYANCIGCGASTQFGSGNDGYADLDGKPFEAYYCPDCAAEQRSSNMQVRPQRVRQVRLHRGPGRAHGDGRP